MSYLLESLGRGLLTRVSDAFRRHLPDVSNDTLDDLEARKAYSATSVDLWLRMGTLYLNNLRLSDARQAFTRAQELSHDPRLPAIGLACVEDELGRHELVLDHLSCAQDADPRDAAIAFAVGLVHERQGNRLVAMSAYERALDLNPNLQNAYERLAAIALYRGDATRAAHEYSRLCVSDGHDFDVLLTHAALLREAGYPDEAEARFQRALLVEPQPEETLAEVEQLTAAGALHAAIDTVGQLVHDYPGVPDYHVQLGDLYVKAGSRAEAIEQYRTALEYQPNMLEATIKLGTQQLRDQEYDDAAQRFSHALMLNDRLVVAFVGLGLSQRDQGRDAEADATFKLAASLDANSTLLFAETARISEIQATRGRQDLFNQGWGDSTGDTLAPMEAPAEHANHQLILEALRRHEQAVRVYPNQATLCYHYGLLLRFLGRDWEAQQAFGQAIEIDNNYTQAHLRLGVGHLSTGAEAEALQSFRRAYDLDQTAMRVRYDLALLFAQRSVFDMALDQYGQQESEHGVDSKSLQANLTLALQQVGLLDRAALTWQSVQTLRLDSLDVASKREAILGEE